MLKLFKNDALLLLPEDLPQGMEYSCYVLVVSITAGRVIVHLDVPESETLRVQSVTTALAESHKVTKREFKGHRRGLLLRRGVLSTVDGAYQHGQVVEYDDKALVIAHDNQLYTVPPRHVHGEVYPVVAMVFGARAWPTAAWMVDRLRKLHSACMDLLLDVTDEESQPPKRLSELLADLELEDGIMLRDDDRVSWIDPESGSAASPSTQHVMNFVMYIEGHVRMPRALRGSVGQSFCREPGATELSAGTKRPHETSKEVPTKRQTKTRRLAFYDVDDTVEDNTHESEELVELATNASDETPLVNGQEVCLIYLSKKGCDPQEEGVCNFKHRVHKIPSSIPQVVMQYLKQSMGD